MDTLIKLISFFIFSFLFVFTGCATNANHVSKKSQESTNAEASESAKLYSLLQESCKARRVEAGEEAFAQEYGSFKECFLVDYAVYTATAKEVVELKKQIKEGGTVVTETPIEFVYLRVVFGKKFSAGELKKVELINAPGETVSPKFSFLKNGFEISVEYDGYVHKKVFEFKKGAKIPSEFVLFLKKIE